MIKINEDLKEKAKKFVLKHYNLYSERSGLEDKWRKWDKLFNNIPDEKYYIGVANLFAPETRGASKTLINFADEILFGSIPFFKMKGTGGEIDKKKAEVLEDFLNIQLEKIRIRTKIRQCLKNAVKFGFSIVKVPYIYKEKNIIKEQKSRNILNDTIKQSLGFIENIFMGQPLKSINKEKKIIYDNIDFINMNPFNIYWNYYTPWENQRCIIEKIDNVSNNHLRLLEKEKIYYGIDEVIQNVSNKTSDENKINIKYPHYTDITGLSGNYDDIKNKHELLECWCNFDIDNDGIEEECIIVIADRQFVIRLEINPYNIQEKPYLFTHWEELEGTSLGIGVPQLAERLQIGLNDFFNQIMDNITQILNNMYIVDEAAEIPDELMKSRPNGIIPSKLGTSAVKPLEKQLTANEGLKAIALTKEYIRQSTSATASMQGLPARYNITATEAQIQSNSSARDVLAILRDFEDNILKGTLERIYNYNIQYISRENFIKIVGEKAAEAFITNEFNGEINFIDVEEFDFVLLGITQIENKIIKTQQLINFLNIVAGLPQSQGVVDFPKLIGRIWQYMGIDDDSIILPQPTDPLISPADENILISQGEYIHAKPQENHQLHIIQHQNLDLPAELEGLKIKHIEEHYNLLNIQQSLTRNIPPQEQPIFSPKGITEGEIRKDINIPVNQFNQIPPERGGLF